jgi:hypothetical protein
MKIKQFICRTFHGEKIELREPVKGLARAFELLISLPDDFFAEGRKDALPQYREAL